MTWKIQQRVGDKSGDFSLIIDEDRKTVAGSVVNIGNGTLRVEILWTGRRGDLRLETTSFEEATGFVAGAAAMLKHVRLDW
jgi:hypothetical protein